MPAGSAAGDNVDPMRIGFLVGRSDSEMLGDGRRERSRRWCWGGGRRREGSPETAGICR
jgi:hypothetical protein